MTGSVWPGKSDLYHAFQAMLIPYHDPEVSVASAVKQGKVKSNLVYEKIAEFGVMPIVFLEDAKDIKSLAEVLMKGDYPVQK